MNDNQPTGDQAGDDTENGNAPLPFTAPVPAESQSDYVEAIAEESVSRGGNYQATFRTPLPENIVSQSEQQVLLKPGSSSRYHSQPVVPPIAGAMTSLFIGVWSIVFCWLTSIVVVNGIVGLGFGLWGLKSSRKLIAVIGMLLCVSAFIVGMYRLSTV